MKLEIPYYAFDNGQNELLLQRLRYNDSPLLDVENPFWNFSYDVIKNEILSVINSNIKFTPVWIEEYEGHFLESKDVIKQQESIRFFLRFIEETSIQIVFKTNAIGGKGYSYLNHKPISFWLGKNSWKCETIDINRQFDKHFLYMNRVPKSYRLKFLYKMYSNGYLSKCNWSWAAHDSSDPFHKSIEGYAIEDKTSDYQVMGLLNEFKTSFVSIVPETFFDDHISNGATFITEKTEKCFSIGSPFIILSTPFFLENLRRLGFKTFSDFWDESYDSATNNIERMNRVLKVIDYISSMTLEECQDMYQKMIPILKHNHEHNKKFYTGNPADWVELDDYQFKFHRELL